MASGGSGCLADLVADRGQLDRTSTAERVASILRERIIEGTVHPGTRLSEDAIGDALGISRNTLREAFRLLSHERLVVHELGHGVFVRTLTAQDVVDLYRLRRLIECGAICSGTPTHEHLGGLRDALRDGERAGAAERWSDVCTANMRFHHEICALAGSSRIDELARQVFAELRLAFHVVADPHTFHAPDLGGNGKILELLEAGDTEGAAEALNTYLHNAERQLITACSTNGH